MTDETGAERTEEVVSRIMRGARDEKIRLDTIRQESEKRIAALNDRISEMDRVYLEEIERMRREFNDTVQRILISHKDETEKLSTERDHYMKWATALETDLGSIAAIINDSLRKRGPPDNGEPTPKFLHDRRPLDARGD